MQKTFYLQTITIMDREIPIEERRKAVFKKRLIVFGILLGLVAIVAIVVSLLGSSVDSDGLLIKKAELATLESSVSASGKIVPLYEQAIVSPVATKILEVYCNEGDAVDSGQSLLRLDLESAEALMRSPVPLPMLSSLFSLATSALRWLTAISFALIRISRSVR